MKLTMFEEVTLMKRACNIHGIGLTELKRILNSKIKADSSKADAVAKTMAKLKTMQISKKTDARSDKESKSLVKVLATKLTPLEEFIAQSKQPDEVKKSAWIKLVFSQGKVSEAQAVALMSHSCMSSLKELDPFQVDKVKLHNDDFTKKAAINFCKRFGLTQ